MFSLVCIAVPLLAGEVDWLTDHAQALEKAKAEKKMVLMDFTGSDWCGWCKKLDKEVFSQEEFKAYAEKNLILLKLDFPKKKELPEKEKNQNAELKAKYQIKGYPSLIVLDSKGNKILEQRGYLKGGPAALIAKLDGLKK